MKRPSKPIWLHNLLQDIFAACPEKLIKCPHCKTTQRLAKDWDYQICVNCRQYMYDCRGGLI